MAIGQRTTVVAAFDSRTQAEQAVDSLLARVVAADQLAVVRLNDAGQVAVDGQRGALADALAVALETQGWLGALVSLGLPEGEARYYEDQAQAGRALVVATAQGTGEEVRNVLRQHGGMDAESQGGALVRGQAGDRPDEEARMATSRPRELTLRWEDVRSRFEMLFEQRFGSSDRAWGSYEPLYRYAWDAANDPRHYGRAWAEVEGAVVPDATARFSDVPRQDVLDVLHDVWEDVADDARRGGEGGEQARRMKPLGQNASGGW